TALVKACPTPRFYGSAIIETADILGRVAALTVQRICHNVIVRRAFLPFPNRDAANRATVGKIHVNENVAVGIRAGEGAGFRTRWILCQRNARREEPYIE